MLGFTANKTKPLYGVTNPFDWMEAISLSHKDNFFEKRVTEYSMASSFRRDRSQNGALQPLKLIFSDDADEDDDGLDF